MDVVEVIALVLLVVEYAIKVVAVGVVPENRRPSSSQAWLLLILFLPVVGVPLFLLIGSPWVRGRRHRIQVEANQQLAIAAEGLPTVPEHLPRQSSLLTSVITMNRDLTSLPCVTGRNEGLYEDTREFYAAMAASVDEATSYVNVEFYIMAWDEVTDVFFAALAAAAERGVTVRLLLDHIGSRGYPGWRQFQRRMTAAGIDWHLMMPIKPLQRRWRRPDLRNHRKLMVVDGTHAYLGSHNVIDPTYGSTRNARMGREWHDLSLRVAGRVVTEIDSVFATDWYTETGESLPRMLPDDVDRAVDADHGGATCPVNGMQVVPSGPGFPTEPNLRLFTQLIHQSVRRVSIVSPYFVPDEALLAAITTACFRGVRVDLYVGEQADQFLVGHAQRSYYRALLEAGVHIWLYPKPLVLHSKYLVVDDEVAAIGSSNMDFRSFALSYEITLLGFAGNLVTALRDNDREYQRVSRELTLTEWQQQPWHQRYLDNLCRLTSALM